MFKNGFLEIITERRNINKWVDVEYEYYAQLKECLKSINDTASTKIDIEKLNKDFQNIQNKLRNYLYKIDKEFKQNKPSSFRNIKSEIGNKMYYPLCFKDFSEQSVTDRVILEHERIKNDLKNLQKKIITLEDIDESKRKLVDQINPKNPFGSIRKILKSGGAQNYFNLIPEQTLILNFNYTSTSDNYFISKEFEQTDSNPKTNTSIIHIHGTVQDTGNNPIVFGYGDELDDDYKEIEKLNNNQYLENIKSINYLKSDNYKCLLEFISSSNYQVFIFGHSCGISDRTMLNTIFEHDNCASIKPFYYNKESGDNYNDMVMNISRNFNDKLKMRDRVVNKMFCIPLIGHY